MSEVAKRLRHRRFQISKEAKVLLHVETPTGSKHVLNVDNASITGIGAWTSDPILEEFGFASGSIMPASKLVFDGAEHTIGRMVLRSINTKDSLSWLAFSAVDSKIPVDSQLARHFTEVLDEPNAAYSFELSSDKFSLANFSDATSTNVDLFSKVHHFNVFMKDWEKSAKFSYKSVRLASMGSRIRLARKRKSNRDDYIIMGSNDYLGLSARIEVREAAKEAIDNYGFGSTGSAVTTGVSDIHVELADTLAKMLGKESVLLFNSGYAANVGILNGLLHAQDLVVADMLSHASIQDGMQMSRGASRFFMHNNTQHLEKILREHRSQYAGCLIVTEGVFSMDGDVAPLEKIIAIAKEYKARVMVDEAHSFGILGHHGLGACELFNVQPQTDLIMGTFSKICGGIGGFVAASEEVVNWLHVWARSHVFSVSIPPSTAAAALRALKIFKNEPQLLQTLRRNIEHFKRGLASLGYNIPSDHQSAVIPVIIGDEKKLETMNQVMMDAGVFVIPIVYPAVGKHNCRFRFTVMATHSVSDLDYVLNVLELAMERAQFRFDAPDTKLKAS